MPLAELDTSTLARLLTDQDAEVVVNCLGVLQDGPASAAGVQPGDVVVKVAGTPVMNTAQLLDAVAGLRPQSQAVLSVHRGRQQLELTVRVAQRPKARTARGAPGSGR